VSEYLDQPKSDKLKIRCHKLRKGIKQVGVSQGLGVSENRNCLTALHASLRVKFQQTL